MPVYLITTGPYFALVLRTETRRENLPPVIKVYSHFSIVRRLSYYTSIRNHAELETFRLLNNVCVLSESLVVDKDKNSILR